MALFSVILMMPLFLSYLYALFQIIYNSGPQSVWYYLPRGEGKIWGGGDHVGKRERRGISESNCYFMENTKDVTETQGCLPKRKYLGITGVYMSSLLLSSLTVKQAQKFKHLEAVPSSWIVSVLHTSADNKPQTTSMLKTASISLQCFVT